MVFRRAWAASRWTGPSHATMFTGLIPQNHGYMLGNRSYLDASAVTLAEILKGAGYRTGCFSNNLFVSPDFGTTQGFETFEPIYLRGPDDVSRAAETSDAAANWAESVHRRGERFFLFINDIEPHLPYTPPAEFQRRFVPASADPAHVARSRTFRHPYQMGYHLGLVNVSPETLDTLGRLYDGEIAAVDAAIGRLVKRFEAAGILDETVFIVAGDHGESLGEHRLIGHQYGMYANLLHVPLLVRHPGTFDGGRVVDDLVRLEDLMPTCLELCGIPVPQKIDGRSLTRDLPGRIAFGAVGRIQGLPKVQEMWPDADLGGFLPSMRSVCDGRHHLILTSDGTELLFDLEADPGETRNLAEELPDVATRLRALAGDL